MIFLEGLECPNIVSVRLAKIASLLAHSDVRQGEEGMSFETLYVCYFHSVRVFCSCGVQVQFIICVCTNTRPLLHGTIRNGDMI